MGLFDRFKKLLKKKVKNTPEEVKDTTIVPYDTSLVILPKYKELSKQEQEEVKSYKQEINIDNMKTLILYSTEMTNYANINVNLLLKAYFSLIEKPADWQLEKMNVEEVQRARIDAMIQEEELQIYLAGLSNLKQESVLRAVAIEEIIKQESKRKIDFLGLFGHSERMRKRNQLEQLSAAEERMKITVKTMEQLMQAVNNTMKTHENTVFVSEVYNTVLNTRKEMISRIESEKREILQKKLNKTLDLATLVIPNEIEQFKMITNDLDNLNLEKEREIIKKIAFMQRKITIYANTHQSEIPLLNENLYLFCIYFLFGCAGSSLL